MKRAYVDEKKQAVDFISFIIEYCPVFCVAVAGRATSLQRFVVPWFSVL